MEKWKTVEDYPNYEISNFGRLRNKNTSYILKEIIDKSGYITFGVTVNGKSKFLKSHRLVALNFIPNPNNKLEVNHIDEDKSNNRVVNLEWCDRKYNVNYGNRNEIVSKKVSKPIVVIYPNGTRKTYSSAKVCSDILNLHRQSIVDVLKNRRPSHKGLKFEYAEIR